MEWVLEFTTILVEVFISVFIPVFGILFALSLLVALVAIHVIEAFRKRNMKDGQ